MPNGASAASSPVAAATGPSVASDGPIAARRVPPAGASSGAGWPRRQRTARADPRGWRRRTPRTGRARPRAVVSTRRQLVVVLLEQVANTPERVALVLLRVERELPVPAVKQSFAFSTPSTPRIACVRARSSLGLTWTSSEASSRSSRVRNQCLSPLATITTASVATRPSSVRPASSPKRCWRSTSCATSRSGSIQWTPIRGDAATYVPTSSFNPASAASPLPITIQRSTGRSSPCSVSSVAALTDQRLLCVQSQRAKCRAARTLTTTASTIAAATPASSSALPPSAPPAARFTPTSTRRRRGSPRRAARRPWWRKRPGGASRRGRSQSRSCAPTPRRTRRRRGGSSPRGRRTRRRRE